MGKLFSKTDFVHGTICPKWLWMQRNMPEAFDGRWLDTAKMNMGTEIGELARGYFGPYELIRGSFRHLERMAEKTAMAIAEGPGTICEAAFVAGGCVCLVDILRVLPGNGLELVEVKSSTKVKPEHITDASFQAAVVRAAMPGWDVRKVSLMHVDPSYVRGDDVDIRRLFAVEDVTDRLVPPCEVMGLVEGMRAYMALPDEPDKEIGRHCNATHPCPYQGYCLKGRDDGICELAGRGRVKGFELIARGISSYGEALDGLKLSGLALAQASARAKGATRFVDRERLRGFMDGLRFPLYFLDFETVQSGIPLYPGTKPYMQVATQYSLHWLDAPDGELRHAEYLAPSEGDPRRGIAEALCRDIPEDACVAAYNMSFERGRLKELAALYPDLAGHLLGIEGNVVDLMVPFQKGWVYDAAMGGSCSIKKVLPALYPDDPELDYHALEGVHCGTEATAAFLKLAKLPAEERMRLREQLLRYCELDTLAMVKVWQALNAYAAE